MLKKKFLKFFRSIIKIILPAISNILVCIRSNKRVANYLNEKSHKSNNYYDFTENISDLLNSEKIISLDVGAQGGFNSDKFFQEKYEKFFEVIAVEPQSEEFKKLKSKHKYVIQKGLWSEKIKKKLYILGKRKGSSSMYEPEDEFLGLQNFKKKNNDNFFVTEKVDIECDTLQNSLKELNIKKLDYLKLDTQGSEFEILKGIGDYKPLLIRSEIQVFSLYKNVPSWDKLINRLYELNYIVCDWKDIGPHKTRSPIEVDMIFIPNFRNNTGKDLIIKNQNKFISLLLIFGHIELLKFLSTDIKIFSYDKINQISDRYFF